MKYVEYFFVIFTEKNGEIYNGWKDFIHMKMNCGNNNTIGTNYNPSFYRIVQPSMCNKSSLPIGYYFYSYSKNVGDYQPSGSCQYTSEDKRSLEFTFPDNIGEIDVHVYVVNINVVNIHKNIITLAYS